MTRFRPADTERTRTRRLRPAKPARVVVVVVSGAKTSRRLAGNRRLVAQRLRSNDGPVLHDVPPSNQPPVRARDDLHAETRQPPGGVVAVVPVGIVRVVRVRHRVRGSFPHRHLHRHRSHRKAAVRVHDPLARSIEPHVELTVGVAGDEPAAAAIRHERAAQRVRGRRRRHRPAARRRRTNEVVQLVDAKLPGAHPRRRPVNAHAPSVLHGGGVGTPGLRRVTRRLRASPCRCCCGGGVGALGPRSRRRGRRLRLRRRRPQLDVLHPKRRESVRVRRPRRAEHLRRRPAEPHRARQHRRLGPSGVAPAPVPYPHRVLGIRGDGHDPRRAAPRNVGVAETRSERDRHHRALPGLVPKPRHLPPGGDVPDARARRSAASLSRRGPTSGYVGGERDNLVVVPAEEPLSPRARVEHHPHGAARVHPHDAPVPPGALVDPLVVQFAVVVAVEGGSGLGRIRPSLRRRGEHAALARDGAAVRPLYREILLGPLRASPGVAIVPVGRRKHAGATRRVDNLIGG